MASARLSRLLKQAEDDAKMDLSPMIDMVFLLLIFFMVASRMVTVKLDPTIKPPIADAATKSPQQKARFYVNLYADGTIKNGAGDVTWTAAELTEKVKAHVEHQKNIGNEKYVTLVLRADKDVVVREVKRVTKAAAEGGITKVVFGSFQTAKF